MHAAVVEFDSLADAVGPAAQHHDLAVLGHADPVRRVIGRIVVGRVFDAAHRHGVPGFGNPRRQALPADVLFLHPQNLGQVAVGKSVLLGPDQYLIGQRLAFMRQNLFFELDQFPHLLDKPLLDVGFGVQGVDGGAFAQGFIHDELPFTGGFAEQLHQFIERPGVEILDEAQAVTLFLQRPNGFLKSFLVIFSDAHDFAHGAHLRTELVGCAGEFFEIPAGELHHDVVARRRVLIQRALAPVGNFIERNAGGQHRGDERDGKAGGLGGQRRRTRRAGIDFDDDHAVRFRIVRKLYVRSADHLNGLDDIVRIFLEPLLQLVGNRQHRRGAVGIARVDPHGIDVFDEADGDHVVFRVADDFQLQLLPADDGFFDQNLADEACGDAAACDHPQFLQVVYDAAARAAHGIGRSDHHRIAHFGGDLFRFLHGGGGLAFRHVDSQFVHRFLERDAVFTALDRVHLNADDLDAVLVQNALAVKLGGQVETGLAAQIRQNRVGLFVFNDLRQRLSVERFDVRDVGHARVGHDRGRVGIDQNDFVAELGERLAGLGSRVVEFAGLADDNRSGADNQNFFNVFTFCHKKSFWFSPWSCP